MDIRPISINMDKLDEWCAKIPSCRNFFENFFLTIEGTPCWQATENFKYDLRSYSRTNKGMRENLGLMGDVFYGAEDLLKRGVNVFLGKDFSLSKFILGVRSRSKDEIKESMGVLRKYFGEKNNGVDIYHITKSLDDLFKQMNDVIDNVWG